jgi:hypothetical protein
MPAKAQAAPGTALFPARRHPRNSGSLALGEMAPHPNIFPAHGLWKMLGHGLFD